MNRLGVTGIIDAAGGPQNFPDDYTIIQKLAADDELTIRIAYNLLPQKPKTEREDLLRWMKSTRYQDGTDFLRMNGAGEMLVWSAADYEDFRVARPELPPEMEPELEDFVRLLVQNRWPWRMHATYDETISRALDVFEKVNADIPFDGLHWFFDHAETISPRSIDRVARLGGGVAIQHRMAFQGEYFVERYGSAAAEHTPPIERLLASGAPVSAGTDATRVSTYNPRIAIHWLVSGRSVSGLRLASDSNRVDRETALRMWTERVAWFSGDDGRRGRIESGLLADFAALSSDLFSVSEDDIPGITAHLTVLGGKIVYGARELKPLDPPVPTPMPDWSPLAHFGGYQHTKAPVQARARTCTHAHHAEPGHRSSAGLWRPGHRLCWAF